MYNRAMPAVSVLLPCYNAADTLPDALESLARQTLQDFEVIAIDDGSSDATPALLQARARNDPRLRILSQPHAGIVDALNRGLSECRAGYVARMDSDDYAYPQRLERQLAFLETHAEVAVLGCLVEGFPPEQVRQGFQIYLEWQNALLTHEQICREIFVESPLAHPSVTFRREWVLRCGGYQDHGWAEDYDLWLRLYLAGARFAKVPEVLVAWRESPGRLTRTDSRYSVENFLRAKAAYLMAGPLAERDAVLVWGAGMIGRRLSKHLLRLSAPLVAFIDIDPKKIGRARRGLPILSPLEVLGCWQRYQHPAVLAAVGARGARAIIRRELQEMGLREGVDWWGVA